jgi:hypothetical protein
VVVLKPDLSLEVFDGSKQQDAGALPDLLRLPGATMAIAGGKHHWLALLSNGSVVQLGCKAADEVPGELGCGTPPPQAQDGSVVAIYAHDAASFALRRDGSLVGWGDGVVSPPQELMLINSSTVTPPSAATAAISADISADQATTQASNATFILQGLQVGHQGFCQCFSQRPPPPRR